MDQKLPVLPDAGTFGRVWRRVMPNDRPDCPFTLPPQPRESAAAEAPVCRDEALLGALSQTLELCRALAEQNLTLVRAVTGALPKDA